MEFCNKKLLQLLKYTKSTPVFEELNSELKGFSFQKVKYQHNNDSISIQIHKAMEPQQKGPFDTLNDLLQFYKEFMKPCSENLMINFIQNGKNPNKSRLKLNLKREIIENQTYYIFSIQNIEKLLLLQEKSESKNRLLNAFTHELKTPLNGSIPSLQEVRAHLSNSAGVYMDRAMASLKLLENSLNNIIDYSLVISDQFIIHLSNVDVEEMLEEIFLIVKSQIEVKNLDFTIDIDREILRNHILTDYNRLKQLILNILLNAIQFTMKGNINLSVYLISKSPKIIGFTIEDTGLGISHEKMEKLKIKLKENDGNESLQMNSTGFCLGLVMSQRISLLLGKNGLDIKSSQETGTIVNFSIIDERTYNDHSEETIRRKEKSEVQTNRKISMKSQNKRILESSRLLHSIKTKNYNNQKTMRSLKEQSISCILSEDIMDNEINLEKIVRGYDLSKLQIFSQGNGDDSDFSLHQIKSKSSFVDKSPCLSSSKGGISLHYIASPLLREGKKKLTILKEAEEEQNENTNFCICEDILIVDDDAFNLLSLEMILKGFKLTCAKALNGLEALNLLKKKQKCEATNCKGGFKLIFMDYQMPDLDGVQTTGEIKKLMDGKEINYAPIIGCTAFTAKDEVTNCLNAGMKDVVFKPLNKNVIGNILKEWI